MKKIQLILIALATTIFFSGCATSVQNLTYGKPIGEKTATLIISPNFTVTSFNDDSVKWVYSSNIERPIGGEMPAAAIKVPAGENNIAFNYFRPAYNSPVAYHTGGRGTTTYYSGQSSNPSVSFKDRISINMNPNKIYILDVKYNDSGSAVIKEYTSGGYKNLP